MVTSPLNIPKSGSGHGSGFREMRAGLATAGGRQKWGGCVIENLFRGGDRERGGRRGSFAAARCVPNMNDFVDDHTESDPPPNALRPFIKRSPISERRNRCRRLGTLRRPSPPARPPLKLLEPALLLSLLAAELLVS